MKPGKIVTSAYPPARLDIMFSIALNDKQGKFYGNDPRTLPKMALETADDIPYTLILHRMEYSVVPVGGSVEWEDAVGKKFGEGKLDLRLQPGEHGFDCDVPLDTPVSVLQRSCSRSKMPRELCNIPRYLLKTERMLTCSLDSGCKRR